MIYRIEIGLKDGVPDARGRGVIHRAAGALKMNIAECRTRDVYKVVANVDDATAAAVQKTFADPVVAQSAMGRLPAPASFDWVLEIGFKPGVTDNVGRAAPSRISWVANSNGKSRSIPVFNISSPASSPTQMSNISAKTCWPIR